MFLLQVHKNNFFRRGTSPSLIVILIAIAIVLTGVALINNTNPNPSADSPLFHDINILLKNDSRCVVNLNRGTFQLVDADCRDNFATIYLPNLQYSLWMQTIAGVCPVGQPATTDYCSISSLKVPSKFSLSTYQKYFGKMNENGELVVRLRFYPYPSNLPNP